MKKNAKWHHTPVSLLGLWTLFIFLLGLPVFPVHGEEQAEATREATAEEEKKKDAEKSVQLEDITVMAAQPGVEITPDKTIVRMDEFVKPGDVRTLTDVLKTMGGIDVMRTNPLMASPGDEVSIRGMNEGRLVVEIDGRRINHSGYYGRYIVDWSSLNLDDIEKIEIIRGGSSVLHPFAIGGVINIITKKGKKTDDPTPTVKARPVWAPSPPPPSLFPSKGAHLISWGMIFRSTTATATAICEITIRIPRH